MANNLNYIVTLTGFTTKEFTSLKQELEGLKNMVSQGVDFPIRLSGANVRSLQQQVKDAIRDSLRATEGGGAPVASTGRGESVVMDTELKSSIDALGAKVDKLVAALGSRPPGERDLPPGRRVGAEERALRQLNGSMASLDYGLNIALNDARNKRADVSRAEGLLAEAKKALSSSGSEFVSELETMTRKLTGMNRSAESPKAKLKLQDDLEQFFGNLQSVLQRAQARAGQILVDRVAQSTGMPQASFESKMQEMSQADIKALGVAIGSVVSEAIRSSLAGLTPTDPSVEAKILRRDTPVSELEAKAYLDQAAGSQYSQLERRKGIVEKKLRRAIDQSNTKVRKELEDELDQILTEMGGASHEGGPAQSSRAQANLAEAFAGDPNGARAKAYAMGQKWFSKLRPDQKHAMISLSGQGMIGLTSGSQADVTATLNRLMSNPPAALFAREDNPGAEQTSFLRRLSSERKVLEGAISGGTLPQGVTAIPSSAAWALAELMRRRYELEQMKELSADEQQELSQLQDTTRQLPILSKLGRNTKSRYTNLEGSRNFVMAESMGLSTSRFLPFDEKDDPQYALGLTPVSLQDALKAGAITQEQFASKQNRMQEWATGQGLQFYRQSARRERAIEQWIADVSRVKRSIEDGELPADTDRMLLDYSVAMSGHASTLQSEPALQRLHEFISSQPASSRARRIDPNAYRDVIQALETRQNLASRELQQGGTWGRATDTFIQQRGAMVNGMPMILSSGEYAFGEFVLPEGSIKPGQRAFDRGDGAHGGGSGGFPPVSLGAVPPGRAVPVFVVGASPGIFGAGTGGMPTAKIEGQLSGLQQAKVLEAMSIGQARIKTQQELANVSIDTRRRRGELDIELGRRRAENTELKRLLGTNTGSFGDIDLRSPFGVDAAGYQKDPKLLRRHIRKLVSKIAEREASITLNDLAAQTETDPKQRAKYFGQRDSAIRTSTLTQIQLASLLQTAGLGGSAVSDFLSVAPAYAGGRRAQGMLLDIAESRSTNRNRQLHFEQIIGSAMPLLEAVRQGPAAIKLQDKAIAEERRLKSQENIVKRLEDQARAMPTASVFAQQLLGAGNIGEAAKLVRNAAGLPSLEGIGPAIRDKNSPRGFSADQAVAFVEQKKEELNSRIVLERQALAETRAKAVNARREATLAVSATNLPDIQAKLFQILNVDSVAKAEREISRLQKELGAVLGVIGKLDVKSQETLNNMSKLFGREIKDAKMLGEAMDDVAKKFSAAGTSVIDTASGATGEASSEASATFRGSVLRKMLSLSQYALAGSVVYTFANVVRQTTRSVIGFEADLKRIQGVLETRSAAAAGMIGRGVIDNAAAYGTDVQSSLRAAKTFAQIGASPTEVINLSRAALAGQVGAGLEPQQATELLIATRNITNERVAPMEILDRISKIEAQYAVSAQDLSEGIQRVGSLATQLQPGLIGSTDALDTVIGSITAIVERTRVSGNQAATALRFMISRLAAPEVARELQGTYGIRLAGDNPREMRPLQDILSEISDTYNRLRSNGETVKANELLTTFAGARQVNTAAALLGDFNSVLDIAAESSLAFGDAQERAALQLNTVESRLTQLNTAFFSMTTTVLDQSGVLEGFKLAVRGATGALNMLNPGDGRASNLVASGMVGGAGLGLYLARNRLAQAAAARVGGSAIVSGVLGAEGATALGATAAAGMTVAGVAGAALAVLVAGGQLFRMGAERGMFGDRFDPYRGSYSVPETVREEYRRRSDALGEELGISGGTMMEGSLAAFAQARAVFGEQRFRRLVNGDMPETMRPGEFKAFEEILLQQFRQVIPGFKDLRDQTEQLALAMQGLRLGVQGQDMANQEATRSSREGLEALLETLTGRLQSRVSTMFTRRDGPVGVDPTAPGVATRIVNMTASEVSDALSQLFSVPGGNLLPGLGRMTFQYGSAYNTLVGRASALQQGEGSLATATTQAIREAFELPEPVKNLYYTTLMRQASQNRGVIGDTQSIVAAMNATLRETRQAALTTEQVAVLGNIERFGSEARAAVRSRVTPRGPAPGVRGTEDDGGVAANMLLQMLQRQAQVAIAQFSAENRTEDTTAFLRYSRALNDRSARAAMMADLRDSSDDSVSIRNRFLTPYFNLASRQADIRTGLRLRDVGFEYDELGAREAALRGFVEDLGRVGPESMRDNLMGIFSLAQRTSTRSRTDYMEWLLSDEGGSFRITDDTQRRMRSALPDDVSLMTPEQVAKLRSRIELQQRVIQKFQTDYASIFELPQSIVTQLGDARIMLAQMSGVADSGELERNGQAVAVMIEQILNTTRTIEEAFAIAAPQAGAARNRVIDRNRTIREQADRAFQARLDEETAVADVRRGNMRTAASLMRRGRPGEASFYDLVTLQRQLQSADTQLAREEQTIRDSLRRSGRFNDNTPAFEEAVQTEMTGFRRSYLQSRQQIGQQGADILDRERMRLADAREQEFQEVLQGSTRGLRDVLMDFDKLRLQPLQTIVPAIADTFQTKIVDNFMDSLTGPYGILTDRMRDAFDRGGLYTFSKIYDGHVKGMEAAVQILRSGYAGSGLGTTVPATTTTSGTVQQLLSPSQIPGAYQYWLNSPELQAAFPSFESMTAEDFAEVAPLMAVAAASAPAATGTTVMTTPTGPTGPSKAERMQNFKSTALTMVGQIGGSAISQNMNGGNNYGSELSSIGAVVGNFLLPGMGGMIGGLAGGLLGGFLKKPGPKQDPQMAALEKIERNTASQVQLLESQTKLMTLDSRFLNVGAGFTIPSYRPFTATSGGGSMIAAGAVQITVNAAPGMDAAVVADHVAVALRKELSGRGTGFDLRMM